MAILSKYILLVSAAKVTYELYSKVKKDKNSGKGKKHNRRKTDMKFRKDDKQRIIEHDSII